MPSRLTGSVDFCRLVLPCTVIKSTPTDSALLTNSSVSLWLMNEEGEGEGVVGW